MNLEDCSSEIFEWSFVVKNFVCTTFKNIMPNDMPSSINHSSNFYIYKSTYVFRFLKIVYQITNEVK